MNNNMIISKIQKLDSPFLVVCAVYSLIAITFAIPLLELLLQWLGSEEYGHGLLLTGIALFMLWQRRGHIEQLRYDPNIWGLLGLAGSLFLYYVAIVGDIQIVSFYSMSFCLLMAPLALFGTVGAKTFLFPIVLIFASIPFHPAINTALTTNLQLISTDIGVWFIRLMGLAALQEGNVIHMGSFVMLVEEACSGLRYLMPLFSINLLAAYYFKGPIYLRLLIVIASVPITVFMNSLRIALTGLIIKYFGQDAAKGFLHDFEGVVIFVATCFLMLLTLMLISSMIGRGLNLKHSFQFQSRSLPTDSTKINTEKLTDNLSLKALMLFAIIILGGTINNLVQFHKTEVIPSRESFIEFPLSLDDRDLYPNTLDEKFLEILKPGDYFIGDFVADNRPPINLYMAYYESQKNGSLIHSPAQCIPAGGWEIASNKIVDLTRFGLVGQANRSIIEKSEDRLLVYYWVNQQGQNFAKNSEVYVSLIRRSIIYSRTDGALVRVIIPIEDGNEADAEEKLGRFLTALSAVLPRFLPE